MRFRYIRVLVSCVACLLLVATASASDFKRPLRWRAIPSQPAPSPKQDAFKSDVSQRNLLGLERPTPFSLPRARRGLPISSSLARVLADTIRVLVLKVEFQSEVPDNPRTTGIGTFDLRTYDEFVAQEGHDIDPAPHNTSFFDSHMEALRRYWYFVSDERLQLTWDIYPQAESAAFRLPVPMSYYPYLGSQDGIPWQHVGDQLGQFLIDAIKLADSTDSEIDFSRYQAIIVFHAGSDQQNNIAFINDTPDDFYTGFLRLSEPIPVDNGTTEVDEGMIIPETVSQDNRVNALNAVLAHEFGHQLGLADFYNTANFMTQVGDFSLMDNNGMSVGVQFTENGPTVGGTVPVYPDAWSRAFLGFDVPREITAGIDDTLAAAALNYSSQEIIKAAVTDFEYFLVENRQQTDTLTVLIGDPSTHVILGPGRLENDSILVATGEYDILLPGNGALIWHVDEFVAYLDYPGSGQNNYYNNTLQWDKDRRFVTVVEADGVVDFGGNYFRGFGDDRDFFKVGNSVAFTPYSNPSSRTNLGADSHVNIVDFSVSDAFMTVDVHVDWMLAGWPQMSQPTRVSDPVAVDLDRDDTSEVMMASSNNILIWRHDGRKFIDNADSVGILRFDSTVAVYPLALAAECDTSIIGRPVPVDLNGDGMLEVVAATASGRLYAFCSRDENQDGRADMAPGFPLLPHVEQPPIAVHFLSRPGMELVASNRSQVHVITYAGSDTVVFGTSGEITSQAAYTVAGKNVMDFATIPPPDYGSPQRDYVAVFRIAADSGSISFSLQFSVPISMSGPANIASGDMDRDGGLPEIVVVLPNAVKLIGADGLIKWSNDVGKSLGPPALGDMNADGYPEIVVAGDSKIYAFSRSGALLTNFPINLSLYDLSGVIEARPVLGDVDGDGKPDIIVGLPSGTVYAFNWRGDRVGGFPLPSSFGIDHACALADLDSDGDIDLISIESSGFVRAWDISASYFPVNVPWGFSGGNVFNSNYLWPIYEKAVVVSDAQLPENSVFNYPNPARNSTTIRYYLNSDSNVKIDIYDYAGDRIHSVAVRGVAHADNEYVWDCGDVASGVYFCRVEADNGQNKIRRLFKIAIVK